MVKTNKKETMELLPKVKLLFHGLSETTLNYRLRNFLSANFAIFHYRMLHVNNVNYEL